MAGSAEDLLAQVKGASSRLARYQNKDGGWGVWLGTTTVIAHLPPPLRALVRLCHLSGLDGSYVRPLERAGHLLRVQSQKQAASSEKAAIIESCLLLHSALNDAAHLDIAQTAGRELMDRQRPHSGWGAGLFSGNEDVTVSCISALVELFNKTGWTRYRQSAADAWRWLCGRNSKFASVYSTSFLLHLATGSNSYFQELRGLFDKGDWERAFEYDRWVYSKYDKRYYPKSREATERIVATATSHIQYFKDFKIDYFKKPRTSHFSERLLYLIGYYTAVSGSV